LQSSGRSFASDARRAVDDMLNLIQARTPVRDDPYHCEAEL